MPTTVLVAWCFSRYIQSTIMWSATLIAIEAVAARISVSSMALNISSMSFLDFVCYSGYVSAELHV